MNIVKSEGRSTASRAVQIVALIVILAAVCLLPQLIETFALTGTEILMYVVLAVSWLVFSGPTGYVSLAPAAFFGLGIYVAAFMNGQPLIVLMIVGGAAAFIIAALMGAITLRLRGVYFTIFTFGLVELLYNLILFLESELTHSRGRFVDSVPNNTVYYYLVGLAVILLAAAYIIKKSRFGMALVSIGESEDAASHVGINTTRMKILAFAVSSFPMGAVGAAMATRWTYIDPKIAFNSLYSFLPVLMVIFGGKHSLAGPVIGAAVFAYLQEILRVNFSSFYMIGVGAIMVITILFIPEGLVGLAQSVYRKFKASGKNGGGNGLLSGGGAGEEGKS